MNTVNIVSAVNFTGRVTGTAASSAVTAPVAVRMVSTLTQDSTAKIDQILDKATSSFTLAAGATLTIDLTTGQVNPLNESIAGAAAFSKVRFVVCRHESESEASSVTAFGSGSNQFQGPLSAAAAITLLPGESFDLGSPTAAGWTVDGTHKTLQVVNNDGTNDATLRLLVAGSIA